MLGGTSIFVEKLLLCETGTYGNQYRRSYNTQCSAGDLNAITSAVTNVNSVTPTVLAPVLSGFLVPQATPEKNIGIINGWNSKRYSFTAKIVTVNNLSGRLVEIVQGYTDYDGVSMSHHLDGNMVFHINSVTTVREFTENTPTGRMNRASINASNHLLSNDDFSGMYSTNGHEDRIRPADIFTAIGRSMTSMGSGDATIFDNRTTVNHIPCFSRRGNANPANYVSKVLDSYIRASNNVDHENGNDFASVTSSARGYASESMVTHNGFINTISKQVGAGIATSSFTYNDLVRMDANTPNVTKVATLSSMKRAGYYAGQTADWGAADLATVFANTLATAAGSIAMELGLTMVSLKSSNRNSLNGGVVTVPINFESFSNSTDLTQVYNTFLTRFDFEVINLVTNGGMYDYAVELHMDLLRDTFIRVSVNGEPFVDYVTPSFADALMVPVVTSSKDRVNNIATDFDNLMTVIAGELNPRMSEASGISVLNNYSGFGTVPVI